MKTHIHHVHLNISNAKDSLPFYESLLKYLGYRIIDKSPKHIGASNGTTDLWVVQSEGKDQANSFQAKGTGLNHIAFRVSKHKEVLDFDREFLKKWKIVNLYNSPRVFPLYHKGYFSVYFEGPDKVELEVFYIPHFKDRPKKIKKGGLLAQTALPRLF